MSDEPDHLTEPTNSTPLWPWMLLQFLPTLLLAIFGLIIREIPLIDSPKALCAIVLVYGYSLSFIFYKSRGKSFIAALLLSLLVAIVVFAANVILVISIIFVGCFCSANGGRIAP